MKKILIYIGIAIAIYFVWKWWNNRVTITPASQNSGGGTNPVTVTE